MPTSMPKTQRSPSIRLLKVGERLLFKMILPKLRAKFEVRRVPPYSGTEYWLSLTLPFSPSPFPIPSILRLSSVVDAFCFTPAQIRDSIRALFPRRDCFTLVRPVHDEQQLQRLDSLPPGVLRPEFQAGLESLTSLIFEKTRPKQMEGAMLTGPMLAALAQSFVGAINEGAVPTIATAWQVGARVIVEYRLLSASSGFLIFGEKERDVKPFRRPSSRSFLSIAWQIYLSRTFVYLVFRVSANLRFTVAGVCSSFS